MSNTNYDNEVAGAKILLSAFGIHTGGGWVLLQALVKGLDGKIKAACFDSRCIFDSSIITSKFNIDYVRRSFFARLIALMWLAGMTSVGDTLLCFNSLPPLLKPKGRVIVFVHAPHFVGLHRGIRYSLVTTFRIKIERLWFKLGIRNCDEIWVQTAAMHDAMHSLYPSAVIRVIPLVDEDLAMRLSLLPGITARYESNAAQFTFFYPADAVGHKNHENLLRAWEILAKCNRRPRLLLTLGSKEMERVKNGAQINGEVPISLVNLGWLSRDEVLKQMSRSSALIFPSRAETFGLPMLEARALGVPVLASERDFVRDVCIPCQTFDPDSPRSIAMAVLRFMDNDHVLATEYYSAQRFVQEILS